MEINKEKLKEFLLFIKGKTKITSLELIEKDFYLNVILSKLNFKEYPFKGGTCLSKIYLDYFRFSEDLDFTFAEQGILKNKSTNKVKKICKEKINELGKQFETLGLNFVFDKSDKKYVEIGHNNKLVTFKIWYESIFTNTSSFIKIQFNFLEKIMFNLKTKETKSLIKENLTKEEKTYFQEFISFYEPMQLLVYDLKEIVSEKLRSLLTRRAIKSRDAIDILFIYQKYKLKPEDFIKEAKEKIIFAIKNYNKYKENLILIKEKLEKVNFSYGEVKHMMIQDFEKKDFEDFTIKLKLILQKLIDELDYEQIKEGK